MKYNTVKLGEYLYIKGRIGWKGLKKSEYLEASDYRIINGETLTSDGIDWSKAGYISEERYAESPEIMLHEGDILISKDGTIGKIGYVDELEMPSSVASGIFVIRNEQPEIIDTRFIYHFLRSPYFRAFIEMRTEGSVIPHLYQKDFADLDFPLFELDVQKKIASILNSIDDKIALNKKINNNLEQQAQAIYDKQFADINSHKIELSNIIEVRDGTHDSPKAQSEGYSLITSKHLLPFGVDKASANCISKMDFDKINERSLVETQDILMSMIGTIGLISYIPYSAIDFAIKNVALFKTSRTPELAYYFLCYLKSVETQQHIEKCLAGSTQKYISLGELRKMPIYSPSDYELQNFNSLVRPMIDEIVLRVNENTVLAEMRDSLLPKLMSVELDVSSIDI